MYPPLIISPKPLNISYDSYAQVTKMIDPHSIAPRDEIHDHRLILSPPTREEVTCLKSIDDAKEERNRCPTPQLRTVAPKAGRGRGDCESERELAAASFLGSHALGAPLMQ